MRSRSCSMTTIVAPSSIRRWNTPIRVLTSSGCSPTVGSSKTKTVPSWLLPISEASLSLWASPPDSAGVDSPRVRYPRPISDRT